MELKNITSFVVLVFAFLLMVFLPLSASTSTPVEIGSSEDDQVGNYLFDADLGVDGELFEDNSLPGIVLTLNETGTAPNLNTFLEIGFDTTLVGTRTWWDHSTSNFTWTFDVNDVIGDPSMAFSDYKTTHTGEFEVYTEYDDFNNDYTTVPCTLKYDGSLQSSSSLNGTVTFTQNETYVTGSQDLESQMTPGCYMISANGTKWYYIDYFDKDDNTKLYLLTPFAETPPAPPTTAYKRQYSCDMDTFTGSFEKAGTDDVKIASGFRAKEPSISSGHIVNYSGLYVDPIMTEDTYGKITKSFGVFQSGKYDLNAFRGHTGMGMWDGVANAVLQVTQTYETDNSNYGVNININQSERVTSGNYPSGLTCNLDYSAAAVQPETIEKDSTSGGGDDTFTFTTGSGSVTGDDPMDNPPIQYDWVKPSAGTHWYVVVSENNTTSFSIYPNFEEETVSHVTAVKMPAAYRMSGISGGNILSGDGATSSIRGVTGHVGLTNAGNVQAGIGTRGGISMDNSNVDPEETDVAWMGLGACLGTYTDISYGTLGSWYGLGIESPVFNGSAKVKKEIAGVGIDSLLNRAEEGTVENDCTVYGVKIKTIDPGNIFPGVVKYGIYQEGETEQNYFAGKTMIGENETAGITNLQVMDTYTTDADNHAAIVKLKQDDSISLDSTPVGLYAELNFTPPEDEIDVKIDNTGMQLSFDEGSIYVTSTQDFLLSNLRLYYKIKKSGTSTWYTVMAIAQHTITLDREYEDTDDTWPAKALIVADEMFAIRGVNSFADNIDETAGITNKLCGIDGSVDMTSQGTVQVSATGTQGGITLNNTAAQMAMGNCFNTYAAFLSGSVACWNGLNVSTPSFYHHDSYDVVITNEIVGVHIQELLADTDQDAVGENCQAYGIKIEDLNPDELSIDKVFGIYQAGDEHNYLGGSLEVNEYVDINNTSSVRAYLTNQQTRMYFGTPILVELDNTTFDTRIDEFDTTNHEYTADLDGTYQINACV
jgi:hypothetical protein